MGYGGSDEKIKGEFMANGVRNTLSHTRGVISMARSQDFNSASSQFFICHADATFLDGQYAAFGKVCEGMDVVNKIATVNVDWNDRPLETQRMAKVTVDTFGEEYPEPKTLDR
jgi:peptidyl-prolyl cis-trans isomerase B (cyclophilin B)